MRKPAPKKRTVTAFVHLRAQEACDKRWEAMLARLAAFKKRHGHSDVPDVYPAEPALASWARTQRVTMIRRRLRPDRHRKLALLDFVFNRLHEAWEQRYSELVAFRERHGHCEVPRFDKEQRALGLWVASQRSMRREGRIEPEREQRLELLGFTWEYRDQKYEAMLRRLAAYRDEHGHANVPSKWRGDRQLAAWLVQQRHREKRGRLTPEHERQLTAVGVDFRTKPIAPPRARTLARLGVFISHKARFQQRLTALEAFRTRYGHCDVPEGFEDSKLASWVFRMRQRMRAGSLPVDQRRKLEALGLGPHARVRFSGELEWERQLEALLLFRAKNGHCNVPLTHQPDELESWVRRQRQLLRAGELRADRKAKLDAVGFSFVQKRRAGPETWAQDWERGFARLEEYRRRYGHVDGPFRIHYPELSQWVCKQRRYKARGKLDPERIRRLETIGFQWEGNRQKRGLMDAGPLRLVVEFWQQHGHFDIPNDPEHAALFAWAEAQRALAARDRLEEHLHGRLVEIGFPLTPADAAWERMFANLMGLQRRTGSCSPPAGNKLADWLKAQCRIASSGELDASREERLLDLGVELG